MRIASLAAGLVIVFHGFVPAAAFANDGIRVWAEKVAGSDIPVSAVEATINAPAAVVWGIVSNCNDYKKTMISIADAKELSRDGDEDRAFTVVCQVTADLPFPLPDLTSVTRASHTVVPEKHYQRKWQYLRGDYEFNEGSWTVVAVDDTHSKATYRLRAKPKMPVPDSLLGSFQQGTMPKIMTKLRETAVVRAKTYVKPSPKPAPKPAAPAPEPTPVVDAPPAPPVEEAPAKTPIATEPE